MKKILGWMAAAAVIAFLAYMLITGQVAIAWEKVIIYVVFIGGISIAGGIWGRKEQKQDDAFFREHQQDTPTDVPQGTAESILYATDADDADYGSGQGVVRVPVILKGTIFFLVAFIWVMLPFVTMLAAMDDAFADPENIGAFGMLLAVAALLTAGLLWLVGYFCVTIYYSPQGVTVQRGRSRKEYRWSEIDNYTQHNYLYTFRDQTGSRLFFTNSSYEGFDGFFLQYRRTHGGMM